PLPEGRRTDGGRARGGSRGCAAAPAPPGARIVLVIFGLHGRYTVQQTIPGPPDPVQPYIFSCPPGVPGVLAVQPVPQNAAQEGRRPEDAQPPPGRRNSMSDWTELFDGKELRGWAARGEHEWRVAGG